MAIDFKTFLKAVPYVVHSRKPIMLRGRHGVGKSELAYQIAKALGLPIVAIVLTWEVSGGVATGALTQALALVIANVQRGPWDC